MKKLLFVYSDCKDHHDPAIVREKELEIEYIKKSNYLYYEINSNSDKNIKLLAEYILSVINDKVEKVILFFRGSMPTTPNTKTLLRNCFYLEGFISKIEFAFDYYEPLQISYWALNPKILKYCKRKIKIEGCNNLYSGHHDFNYPFFIKPIADPYKIANSSIKTNKVHAVVKNELDLQRFLIPFMEMFDTYNFIVSEYIDIKTSELASDHIYIPNAKVEYRCYIVDNKCINVSRYCDYNSNITNESTAIYDYVDYIAEEIKLNVPYVLDVCVDSEDNIKIVELNHIEYSGRYEDNVVSEIFDALVNYYER